MRQQGRILPGALAFMLVLLSCGLNAAPAVAQTPGNWQSSATGLRTEQNADRETAGLGFIVRQQNWPFLMLRGGAADASGWQHPQTVEGPTRIELGQVKAVGAAGSFAGETADWAHDELRFGTGTGQLKLWVSRLTPAIVAQSAGSSLRLLSGPVAGNQYNGTSVHERPSGPAYPKYVAYPSGGGIQVRRLSTTDLSLTSMDQGWVLVWYGGESHFVDTKTPLSYGAVPWAQVYQADTPILLVFQNRPVGIKHSSEGGVELSFGGGAGYVTMLPLFGRDTRRASETEAWGAGLPAAVRQKAQWWASRLCSYPLTATESYAYTAENDTATITEDINYQQVCAGGTSFAPLPPMLGMVKDTLEVVFSGVVVDGNVATEFGPSLGIENTAHYTWSVSGLNKYVSARPDAGGPGYVPANLKQELEAQVQRLIAGGHWEPWLFMDGLPRYSDRGDAYWLNPGETLYQLAEIAQVLTGPQRANLVNYVRTERAAYPPETVYDVPLEAGSPRATYDNYALNWRYDWSQGRPDVHLTSVPLYNFLGLAKYYELTQEGMPAGLLGQGQAALDRAMREQDWATFYWFEGFGDRRGATWNANRHFAGLVGLSRLAQRAGDAPAEGLARALLAKAAVMRLGMAEYPRYLYEAGVIALPGPPDWQPRNLAWDWTGYLQNYIWATPDDDVRQATTLDQFGTFLYDTTAFDDGDFSHMFSPHLIAFRDMVPELGRLLHDYAWTEVESYTSRIEALTPTWYAAFGEAVYGLEHNLNHPTDSYQTFMAKALVLGQSPQTLAGYLDIPWIATGDLFYMQKLAETIRAYAGSSNPLLTDRLYLPIIRRR